MRNKVLLSSLLLLFAISAIFGATRYNTVAEWNGPYFHIINSPTVDQKVDDPVVDYVFSSPSAVTGVNGSSLPRIFVADQDNNRIQVFETPVKYQVLDINQAWSYTGAAPTAGLEVDDNVIALSPWDVDDILYRIVRGSVVLKIDGEEWSEVDDLTGYAATDKVFQIEYDATAGTEFPEINLPVNSLSPVGTTPCDPNETIEVYFAYTYNATHAADGGGNELAVGLADIDYGMSTAAGVYTLVEINESTANGVSSFQSLEDLFAIANMSTATTTELYILDMADNSTNADEHLFMYTITNAGVIDAIPNEATTLEKYDGLLANPEAICVADVGGHTAVDAAVTNNGVTDIAGVTIADANKVTGHSYEVTTTAVGAVTITDKTTGKVLSNAIAYVAGSTVECIPGVDVEFVNPAATDETDSVITVAADYGRYIFIADTDNDRIKILKMADVDDAQFVGDWLDGDDMTTVTTLPDAGEELSPTTPSTAVACEGWSFFTGTAPIKEGSLDTININGATWTIDPDNNEYNNDENDSLYTVNYFTGEVKFGDGVNGVVVPTSQTCGYTYTTSVDVVRYGNAGTGNGQFANPAGISAIWNEARGWFDVYVADTDNNRIQKLKFEPETTDRPASVSYLAQWNYASSGTDYLSAPGDIHVVQEPGSNLDTIWVMVTDVGNDRVVTFRDLSNVSGSPSTLPTYDRFIGETGNEMGKYMEISSVWALANGTGFDIYVSDADRNFVTKYEEASPVTITLAETGESLLPASYSPAGTYTITYDISGAFECAYVNFYYSADTIYDASDPVIVAENTIDATTGQSTYDWVFANTPGGMPADGDYYIYAKVVSCDGYELANDITTNALTIDSDLTVAFSLRDAFDDDGYLLLQNGAEKDIDITLDYPVGVKNILIYGTSSSDMFEIVSINQGNIFDVEGEARNVVFSSEYDTTGNFEIMMSQTGDPDGCNVSPRGLVATMVIRAKEDMIDTANSVVTGAITINDSISKIYDYLNVEDTSRVINDLVVYGAYLGDIATPGANQGTVPNMFPLPDGSIGFYDLMTWTLGWDGDSVGNHDPLSDLGPTSGVVPDLIMEPDGYISEHDISAFTTMFSWWVDLHAPRVVPFATMSARSVFVETYYEDGMLNAYVNVEDIENLKGAHVIFNYDPRNAELVAIEDGGFLSEGDAEGLVFTRGADDRAEICMARLSRTERTVSGSGTLIKLVFEAREDAEIMFSYELADGNIDIIERGYGRGVPGSGSVAPEAYGLISNIPNPFNSITNITFEMFEGSHVNIEVYDILGSKVSTLINEYREAGTHTVTWEGRDASGNTVNSGEYLIRMETEDGKVHTRRMLYLK